MPYLLMIYSDETVDAAGNGAERAWLGVQLRRLLGTSSEGTA
jgi:hypothetical protein